VRELNGPAKRGRPSSDIGGGCGPHPEARTRLRNGRPCDLGADTYERMDGAQRGAMSVERLSWSAKITIGLCSGYRIGAVRWAQPDYRYLFLNFFQQRMQ
jgi:hypothetical protein